MIKFMIKYLDIYFKWTNSKYTQATKMLNKEIEIFINFISVEYNQFSTS